MIPTIANRKAPRKVDSAFCAVLSSIRSWVARGVTCWAAREKAATMAVSEKVVTASIDEARMVRILSTESLPILRLNSYGISGASQALARARTTDKAEISAARNQI